jgi:GNAT superfamily N-acetyltransferase
MGKTFMRWTFADGASAEPELAAVPPAGSSIARITDAELPDVARLMVDGYRGTIDFEGETDDDALEELEGAVAGANGPPLREAWLLSRTPEGTAASAICCIRWRGMPFISYVFTAADQKGRGYAGALIRHAAAALVEGGESELVLFVTVGNPARTLYERLGFVEAEEPERG